MENKSSVIEHGGKTYSMQDLRNSKINKQKYDTKIIDARDTGSPLSNMDDDGLRYVTDQVIVNGSLIYGCDLPQTEFMANGLSKQIIEYLFEFGYSDLTLAEIILALRINTEPEIKNPLGENIKPIELTRNLIHVSFIGGVLRNYMILRNNLDRKFQNHIDGY